MTISLFELITNGTSSKGR